MLLSLLHGVVDNFCSRTQNDIMASVRLDEVVKCRSLAATEERSPKIKERQDVLTAKASTV